MGGELWLKLFIVFLGLPLLGLYVVDVHVAVYVCDPQPARASGADSYKGNCNFIYIIQARPMYR